MGSSHAPTSVLFLWHMHQPFYRRFSEKNYHLAWVRFHSVKDYYPFVYFLSKFSRIKANFNFSPVLLDQILDYVENRATDKVLELSLKKASDLTSSEIKFLLARFFSVNKENLLNLYPRYLQLFQKSLSVHDVRKYNFQELTDLQVYFNLVWFHSLIVEEDKNLQEIFKKAKNYNEDDKRYIINKHYQIMAKIIPLYKQLAEESRIEIVTSPYYHPILPLLCDTGIIKKYGYLKPPACRFSHSEEALWQIEEAKKRMEALFGREISGSWPSEGGVSEEVLGLYKKAGFKWLATDEDILFKSLAREKLPYELIKNQRYIIYQPYIFKDLLLFFRDRNLSDALSFVYHSWPEEKLAAEDFLQHLNRIHNYIRNIYPKRCVVIVMDGENAWEYYKDNARSFFEHLYLSLEKSQILKTDLFTSFSQDYNFKKINRELWPGSWINADFGVWIGSSENNTYWSILAKIMNEIKKHKHKFSPLILKKVLSCLRIIEGSDFNWWNTFEDKNRDFRKIFSSYVKAISKLLKKDFLYLLRGKKRLDFKRGT